MSEPKESDVCICGHTRNYHDRVKDNDSEVYVYYECNYRCHLNCGCQRFAEAKP